MSRAVSRSFSRVRPKRTRFTRRIERDKATGRPMVAIATFPLSFTGISSSRLERHDDAEHRVRLPHRTAGWGRADMRSAVRRRDLDDFLGRHTDPTSIFLHLVMRAGRTDLGRAAIGKVAAGGLGVGSSE